MSEAAFAQFLTVGITALGIALVSFYFTKRSGLVPAQTLLIATLKDINSAQLAKITELTGVGTLTNTSIMALKVQISELQSSILSLVEENRKLSLALGAPTSTPATRQATEAVEKASTVVNHVDEKTGK